MMLREFQNDAGSRSKRGLFDACSVRLGGDDRKRSLLDGVDSQRPQ